ncbi:hypothetical protein ACQ4M4_27325 [Leptolyngbya sp. AN02str]|uniref:hypothetical protein n=1 Tax=Leptolyngbya sp. AN02str TaxID=3423363 RepID=UPI003D3228B7
MASEQGLDELMRLQVDVPEEVKTAAKIEALKQGKTLSELVEEALRAYLKMTPSAKSNSPKK